MSSVGNPFVETARGLKSFLKGLSWLGKNKKYFLILSLPFFAGFFVFFATFYFGFDLVKEVVLIPVLNYMLSSGSDKTILSPFYSVGLFFAFLLLLLIAILLSTLVVSVFAAPIYEVVSIAVERNFLQSKPPEPTIWKTIRLIFQEIQKAFFCFLVPLLIAFLPVVNILAPFIAAFFLGWNFCDYPMARRGWTFKERFHFVRQEFFSIMGFGFWLLIPFASLALMPLAVVGGTLLSLEAMKRRNVLDRVRF